MCAAIRVGHRVEGFVRQTVAQLVRDGGGIVAS